MSTYWIRSFKSVAEQRYIKKELLKIAMIFTAVFVEIMEEVIYKI
ncbi:hypothetical protein [Polaribacter irgensii]|nr:hypothetical protein [Polaribacter irgensii]